MLARRLLPAARQTTHVGRNVEFARLLQPGTGRQHVLVERVLAPAQIPAAEDALLCVVSTEGKMLAFAVKDLPELPRGKGNKMFGLSSKKVASREEYLAAMAIVAEGQSLIVHSKERKMTLKFAELKDYRGERAQRGAVLPRGWRTVERLEVVSG